MTKVRTGHEDVFIGRTYILENGLHRSIEIPDKYHFDYNTRWVSNTSSTKRIAIRKIKVYPIVCISNILTEFMDQGMHNTIEHNIIYALSDDRSIFELLDYFVNETHRYLAIEYPNAQMTITYQYNNSVVLFTSTFLMPLGFRCTLIGGDMLKVFNVNEDPNNPGQSLPYRLYDNQSNPAYQAFKKIWDRNSFVFTCSF
jgi:hypothetical protein